MTSRDFSTRPVQRSNVVDRALLGLAAVGLAAAVAATVAARRDLLQAMRAVADVRGDSASRPAQPRNRTTLVREALAAQALATVEASPARVFSDLASLMPADVRLNGATLSYEEGGGVAVDLSVVAREGASYDRFLERLGASPRFADILTGSESRGGALAVPVRLRYRASETE